jgi:phage N-6-adenine-methyltransferase
MINRGLFTSNTDLWETPQDFFDALNAKYHFETDVCATPKNAKCERFYTPEQDGLSKVWKGVCWMNPPYGRGIGTWVRKAMESARENGATVVCLIPARTDTAWWHDYIKPYAASIEFIHGRLKFGGGHNTARRFRRLWSCLSLT